VKIEIAFNDHAKHTAASLSSDGLEASKSHSLQDTIQQTLLHHDSHFLCQCRYGASWSLGIRAILGSELDCPAAQLIAH
jgi:hypothetical protein